MRPNRVIHQLDYLGRTDEAAMLLLRKHHVPGHGNIEHAVVSLDEFRRNVKLGFQSRCHTGRAYIEISRGTVGDGYSHFTLLTYWLTG